MKQDINKVEEDIIAATEGLRAIRRLLLNTTADSERARLRECRDHVGTLHVNAQSLSVELGRTLPVLAQFLAESK